MIIVRFAALGNGPGGFERGTGRQGYMDFPSIQNTGLGSNYLGLKG